MKNKLLMVLALAVILPGANLMAVSVPSSISRESMLHAESLDRLGVGVNYEHIQRDIVFDRGNLGALLEANSVDGLFSVDVTSWLTPFVTLGASSATDPGTGVDGDYAFKWSAGLSFNIWHYDVVSPDFMAGRLSIESAVEYARYASQNVGAEGDKVTWSETTVVIPVCYEVFEEQLGLEDKSLQESLNLYVGPAVSFVDGMYSGDQGFQQDREYGVVAGADIFFAEKLSLGGHVLVFNDVSWGISLRYHF